MHLITFNTLNSNYIHLIVNNEEKVSNLSPIDKWNIEKKKEKPAEQNETELSVDGKKIRKNWNE